MAEKDLATVLAEDAEDAVIVSETVSTASSPDPSITEPTPASQIIENSESVEEVSLDDPNLFKNKFKRFKGSKSKTFRIGFITVKIKRAFSHYHEGLGYVYCLQPTSKVCCSKLQQPRKPRFALHIAVFPTDDKGKLLIPASQLLPENVQIMTMVLNSSQCEDLSIINSEWGLLTHDLFISCEDDTYQRLKFQSAKEAILDKLPKLKSGVLSNFEEYSAENPLEKSLGRKLSEEEILAEVGEFTPQAGKPGQTDSIPTEDIDKL